MTDLMHPSDAGEPAAVMVAGDLELHPVYKLGIADQPDKLRAACRTAGIADASLNRERRVFLTEAGQAGYTEGYDYELGRQKVVPRG